MQLLTDLAAREEARLVQRHREMMECWRPGLHPIHCSNCLHAKVSGEAEAPDVTCCFADDKVVKFFKAIRTNSPAAFRAASRCGYFKSMGE